ncbi:hypothetical protein E306M_07120 [Moorella sp. E306M]|jgi:hypothetical protein|nr:hypothetical protein E306M_07120 [Moorella sp. E306M]
MLRSNLSACQYSARDNGGHDNRFHPLTSLRPQYQLSLGELAINLGGLGAEPPKNSVNIPLQAS